MPEKKKGPIKEPEAEKPKEVKEAELALIIKAFTSVPNKDLKAPNKVKKKKP